MVDCSTMNPESPIPMDCDHFPDLNGHNWGHLGHTNWCSTPATCSSTVLSPWFWLIHAAILEDDVPNPTDLCAGVAARLPYPTIEMSLCGYNFQSLSTTLSIVKRPLKSIARDAGPWETSQQWKMAQNPSHRKNGSWFMDIPAWRCP